jgi:hypothetical protein
MIEQWGLRVRVVKDLSGFTLKKQKIFNGETPTTQHLKREDLHSNGVFQSAPFFKAELRERVRG